MSPLAAAPHAPLHTHRQSGSGSERARRSTSREAVCFLLLAAAVCACVPCKLTLRFAVKEQSQAPTQSGCFTLRGKQEGRIVRAAARRRDRARAGCARGAYSEAGLLEGLGAVALEDPDMIVGACCRQKLAVWAPGHVAAPVCVPLETEFGLLDHCWCHCALFCFFGATSFLVGKF